MHARIERLPHYIGQWSVLCVAASEPLITDNSGTAQAAGMAEEVHGSVGN
jgi:hypothetical protein